MQQQPKVAIIGAGVIGLTTGIRLCEEGYDVTIFYRDEPAMASTAAPAMWIPYKVFPEEKILRWSERSLQVYRTLEKSAGIAKLFVTQYFNRLEDKPVWTKVIRDYQEIVADKLPKGYIAGYEVTLFSIDTSIYMPYLLSWFKKLGGTLQRKNLKTIGNVAKQYTVVVNCAGVWSHQLVSDSEIFPIRGQYLLIEKIPKLKDGIFAMYDEDSYILVVPRKNDCYLGGTINYYDWNTATVPATTNNILRRAQQFEPLLKSAVITHVGVGLRPGRKAVRIEVDPAEEKRLLIHNYGHGGAGFTTSWGCADEVLLLIQNHFETVG